MGRGVLASCPTSASRDFTHVAPLPSQTGIVVPEEYKAFYAKLSKEYKYFSFSIAEDPADKKKFLCVDSLPCVLRIAHHTTTLFLATRSFKLHTTYTENLDSKTGDAAMNKAAFDALIKELPAGEPRFLCFYYSLKNAEGRVCDKNLVIKWCVLRGDAGHRLLCVACTLAAPATSQVPRGFRQGAQVRCGRLLRDDQGCLWKLQGALLGRLGRLQGCLR